MWSSWDVHNSSSGTHGLEGAWDATLEGKRDQSGRSLSDIGMKALGSKSPNWSTTKSLTAKRVLWHKESYGSKSPDHERLLIQEGFAWLCIGVLIRQYS